MDLSLDESTKKTLEKELGLAEATVLRLRAQLGYSLSSHLTSRSTSFEQMTQEVLEMRQLLQSTEQRKLDETRALHRKATKYRSQKIFLANQLKRLQFQAQEQISIALAEASEARMAYKRLHTQKELLLAQIETLIQVKRVTDNLQIDRQSPRLDETRSVNVACEPSTSVPYTLVEEDVALLQGEVCVHRLDISCRGHTASSTESHRERLIAFLRKYDPTRIDQVDEMLHNYRGVESLLFESLRLKYQLPNSGTVD
uniref:Uncharacterized protein AlNc14C1G169 n=1 Tax=Albugo laibachii Nc14 TaxID=890382 RepID=F0VZ28_9STRA|nr:conserved hypothetical protein [Albugo laibachii Nc14]|eukprot:CCA14043.1 conserved hypothetical protein [Albugo laibachii Nc14]